MAEWVWWTALGCAVLTAVVACVLSAPYFYIRARYLDHVVRIFEEKPLFVIPRGKAPADAGEIAFPTAGGLSLKGCYLTGRGPRRGVVLFGLEFGSNRWASLQYCSTLLDRGYDVFTYEPRNQGASDTDPTYAPLQWVTEHDVADMRAAVAYLKTRPETPETGIGVFGISKGGCLALAVAAEDPFVRCVVTDGAYATRTTVIPFIRRWASIYVKKTPAWVRRAAPDGIYGLFAGAAIRRSARCRRVEFPPLERVLHRVTVPVQMIHGGGDTYITPAMAESLYTRIPTGAKHLWVVPKAKHNQAVQVAGEEYGRRVAKFFDAHLTVEEAAVILPLPAEPTLGRAVARA